MIYHSLAEVLLACRPVLRSDSPQEALLALQAEAENTLQQLAEALRIAEPSVRRIEQAQKDHIPAREFILSEAERDALWERDRWEYGRRRDLSHITDHLWRLSFWVGATMDIAPAIYLQDEIDKRSLVLTDQAYARTPLAARLEAELARLREADHATRSQRLQDLWVLPVVESESDAAGLNRIVEWKALSTFSAGDLEAIAASYRNYFHNMDTEKYAVLGDKVLEDDDEDDEEDGR